MPASDEPETGTAPACAPAPAGWPASRFLLLLVATVLLPALLLSGVLLWDIAVQERARRQQELFGRAETMMHAVDQQILDSITVLQVLATSDTLAQEDYGHLHDRLSKALEGRNAHILVLDNELNQIINTRVPYGTPLGKTADPESAVEAAERRAPYVSRAFYGRVADRQVFNVVLPVFESEQARHFLILTRNTEWLVPLLDRTHLPGASVVLLDQANEIVATGSKVDRAAAVDLAQLAVGGSGVNTVRAADGTDYVVAIARSAASEWQIVKYVPQSVLDAPLRRSLWLLAGLSLVILALAALAATQVARLLTGPLQALARSASARDLAVALPHASQVREVNVAAAALAEAAAERERHAAHEKVLMRELAHRMRNQFAVIEAIFRQLNARSTAPDEFEAAFTARLQGMSRSVGALAGNAWSSAWLRDLVRAHLEQFAASEGERVRLHGDNMRVNPRAVEAIGLALHELATNSLKYGVLSGDTGELAIAWGREGPQGEAFHLTWRERGGPPVTPPERTGFGSVVLERVVGQQLGGSATLSYAADGVVWRLDCPWESVAQR